MNGVTLKKRHEAHRLGFMSYYEVERDGTIIGSVAKRRGGWWSWWPADGGGGSSWCKTRKEAVEALASRTSDA